MRMRPAQQLSHQGALSSILARIHQQLQRGTGPAAAAATLSPAVAGRAGSHVCDDARMQQNKNSWVNRPGHYASGRLHPPAECSTGTAHQLQWSRGISYCCCLQQQRSSFRTDLNTLAAQASESVTAAQEQNSTVSKVSSQLGKSGRFYDTVSVIPVSPTRSQQEQTASLRESSSRTVYKLQLGTYPIKTPGKNLLALPTYSLALAVAAEWEWLPRGKPVPHLMPLTSLAATAIDQPRDKPKVIEHLLKYVHTDSACIRYEAGPLQRRQAKVFDPLLQWAHQQLMWSLHTTDSIAGTTQPEQTVAAVQQYLEGLDIWRLAAAEQLTTASKSVIIAAAVLHNKLTAAEAIAAARLEEEFQLEDWGMVEAGHDLDIADTKSRITAPAVFCKLLAQP